MSTKLLLLILSACTGAIIGSMLSKRLSLRKKYFSELKRFIDYLISDIKYRRTDIISLVKAFNADESDLKRNLEEFTEILSGGGSLTEGRLKKDEFKEVERILFGLGKVDLETQLFELSAASDSVQTMLTAASERYDRYGALYIKLGLLFGLGLGILMM